MQTGERMRFGKRGRPFNQDFRNKDNNIIRICKKKAAR